MPDRAKDQILKTIVSAITDARNGRYLAARRKAQSLDDAIYLLGDPDDMLWVTWSALHFSLFTLSATDDDYVIPEEFVSTVTKSLGEAETQFVAAWESDNASLLFDCLVKFTASAGEASHSANLHCYPEKRPNNDR